MRGEELQQSNKWKYLHHRYTTPIFQILVFSMIEYNEDHMIFKIFFSSFYKIHIQKENLSIKVWMRNEKICGLYSQVYIEWWYLLNSQLTIRSKKCFFSLKSINLMCKIMSVNYFLLRITQHLVDWSVPILVLIRT